VGQPGGDVSGTTARAYVTSNESTYGGDDTGVTAAVKLDFSDPSNAFAGIPTKSLVRAAVVFSICRIEFLTSNAEALLDFSNKFLGKKITSLLLRPTFFNHFCAGEDEESIKPMIE
jgi:proline dehydrogenase